MIRITLLGRGLLILNPGPRGLGMMGRESGPEGGGGWKRSTSKRDYRKGSYFINTGS